jgi:5-methyltetrahydrofolate--homocysteine methyltransferase
MRTFVSSAAKVVNIAPDLPTVLIGERINPTGKKKLAAALTAHDLGLAQSLAVSQVAAGADILDVNVGAAGVDEVTMLPQAVRAIQEVADVPLCLDSDNPAALSAALKVCEGKPIINSVNGQEERLRQILPLVKEHGAAVIGLALDDEGIPQDVDRRVAIAMRIVARAEALGISREDVIIDSLALTVAADSRAVLTTLQTIRRIRDELGVNQTLGASNVSFGLPERDVINVAFLALAIASGVTCPFVHVQKVRPAVSATDLLLGRDEYAMRYIRQYREREKSTRS